MLGPQTRRLPGVVGRLIGQLAPADRDAGPGAQRDVEKDHATSPPENPCFRHHVLFVRRGEILDREIDAGELGVSVQIDSGPRGQRSGHGHERGARATVQDAARVQVLGTVRQHEHGVVGCHVTDRDAQPLRKSDLRESCSRLLEASGLAIVSPHFDVRRRSPAVLESRQRPSCAARPPPARAGRSPPRAA